MATATQTTNKEIKVSNKQEMPDFSKLTMSERLAWIKKLENDTIAASQKEYEDAINYTVKAGQVTWPQRVGHCK